MGKTRESANLVSGYNVFSNVSNNRVGIATSNPQYTFDILGDLNFTGNLNQGGSTFVASRWSSGSGNDIYRLNGSVGIGTTNPQSTIHTVVSTGRALFETNSGNVNSILNLWNNNSSSSAGTGLLFSAGSGTSGITSFIGGISAGRIDSNNNSSLYFRVLSNGSLTSADNNAVLYLQGNSSGATFISNANVGIGSTIPSSRLSVGGTITELYQGQYWNVVTQADIGIGASQVPLNQHLGQLAFLDEYGNNIPQNSQTASYTLVRADGGKHISITTGGVTVPAGVFEIGDTVSIYNNSGSSQTITQGGSVTLRLAGTSSTGNRTLGLYGLCSILCVASNTFVISGAGLS